MTSFGWFQPSVLGMQEHSHAFETISGNIANMTTNAYKRSDTEFKTLLSRTWASASADPSGPLSTQSDIGGTRAVDYARIAEQGQIQSTGRALDVAVNGQGFFMLSTALDGTGETVYGRDGAFSIASGPEISVTDTDSRTFTVNQGYLVDGNGYYVQGWRADGAGGTSAGGTPASMRVDAYAFTDSGQATADAALALNLPAEDAAGTQRAYRMQVFDSAGGARSLDLAFTKSATPNTWAVQVSDAAGDPVTVTPPAAGGTPGQGEDLRFDGFGRLAAPSAYTIVYGNGANSNFVLDVRDLTQVAGDFQVRSFSQDGYGPGNLETIGFDEGGYLVGTFDNGHSRPLYRLALADFANADGLTALSSNVYAVSETSGLPVLGGAGEGGLGAISPQSLELSNVELSDEFSRMILTQNAYNSSATAFRTMDEMTEAARDLKR